MFKLERDELIQQMKWRDLSRDEVRYVEAWKYARLGACTQENFRHGILPDSEIERWLRQVVGLTSSIAIVLKLVGTAYHDFSCCIAFFSAAIKKASGYFVLLTLSQGQYAPPVPSHNSGDLQGVIRILICDRSNMYPAVGISEKSFLRVEEAFHLLPATIPSLFQHEGLWFKHISYNSDSGEVERVDFVIKAVQKVEVANYLLSLSHHVPTGVTTAFICGDGVMTPRYFDYESQFDHIISLIGSSPPLWVHPMFLPTVILQNHWRRTAHRSQSLEDDVVRLEQIMGVSFAGRTANMRVAADWPANIDVRAATVELHTTMTQVIFVSRVCEWDCGFATFLLKTSKELQHVFPEARSIITERASRELLDLVNYVENAGNGTRKFVEAMKERIQAQANVVLDHSRQRDERPEADFPIVIQCLCPT